MTYMMAMVTFLASPIDGVSAEDYAALKAAEGAGTGPVFRIAAGVFVVLLFAFFWVMRDVDSSSDNGPRHYGGRP